jgi:DNA invertase Pin-like site-specific DNA recombinase
MFADDGITGKAEGIAKRKQYRRLVDAIEAGECRVVISDEVSRLTRDFLEGGRLMKYVDDLGVRFITHDGIDTLQPGWKPLWMVKLMAATMEVESTAERVTRGMVGQLDRGYQIAQPPFGYRAAPELAPSGRVLGTKWTIHEAEARVIRQMYQWRFEGLSFPAIAALLQKGGVQPPGKLRKRAQAYWRAATVQRLTRNKVYRGVFVWNGSSFTKAKARKRRRQVNEISFEREELRIVSDELWFACNAKSESNEEERRPRGGGKNFLAGLVRCGDCQVLMSIGSTQGMHCPNCHQARRVGAIQECMGYTSTSAARLALEWALAHVFTGEVRKELDSRLAARLHAGPAKELSEVGSQLKDTDAQIERIQTFMLNPNVDPKLWEPKLEKLSHEKTALEHRLTRLRASAKQFTPAVLDLQLGTNPLPVLHELLSGAEKPHYVRATLRRLLKKFEFVEKPSRYVSVFRIALQPGVALAEISDSVLLDSSDFEFEVTCSTTAHRPVAWSVNGRMVTG